MRPHRNPAVTLYNLAGVTSNPFFLKAVAVDHKLGVARSQSEVDFMRATLAYSRS